MASTHQARSIVSFVLALSLLGPAGMSAYAENVVDSGADGANGAAGASGNPGAPGDPGGNGGNANAAAGPGPGRDPDNIATATGGRGGNGGSGGAGSPSGADGGDGGAGGNATADADTSLTGDANDATASATATGGRGGSAATGGTASGGGTRGDNGVAGGGDATANADADTDEVGDVSASAAANAGAGGNGAFGGVGGPGGASAGGATSAGGAASSNITAGMNAGGGDVVVDSIASGSADANATSGQMGGAVRQANSAADAAVSGGVAAQASSSLAGGTAPTALDAAGAGLASLLVGLPDIASVANVLHTGSNPNAALDYALQQDPDDAVLAAGVFGGSGGDGTLSLAIDITAITDPQQLLLSLLDVSIANNGFDSLTFSVDVEGVTLIDQTFNNAAADSFFNDNTNVLLTDYSGVSADGILNLDMFFDITGQLGDEYTFNWVLGDSVVGVVPIPAAVWFMGSALACLIGWQRRKV